MKEIYIGIDPSVNSTGITVLCGEELKFYLVVPHVTKKQKSVDVPFFKFILYEKHETDKKNSDIFEHIKTQNIVNLCEKIRYIINTLCQNTDKTHVHICIEGLAMGAVRTVSLCELAGMNYILRYMLREYDLHIAPPTVIKKFACGAGNARKEIINTLFLNKITEINELKSNIGKTDDIADSYFMMKYIMKTERPTPILKLV